MEKKDSELLYEFVHDFILKNPMQVVEIVGTLHLIIGELIYKACSDVQYDEEDVDE